MIAIARRQPDRLPGGGFGFWLESWEIGVDDLPPLEERAALEKAGRLAAEVWRRYRARGLDANGNPMRPISLPTRIARDDDVSPVTGRKPYSPMGRASSGNAPLQATGAASRTQTLLRFKAVPGRGVWFYWLTDRHSGRPWGEILSYHRKGFARFFVYPHRGWGYVPSRDVFGFSPAEMAEIRMGLGGTIRRHGPAKPMTTREIIAQVRAAKPAEKKKPRWVEGPVEEETLVLGPRVELREEPPAAPVEAPVESPKPSGTAKQAKRKAAKRPAPEPAIAEAEQEAAKPAAAATVAEKPQKEATKPAETAAAASAEKPQREVAPIPMAAPVPQSPVIVGDSGTAVPSPVKPLAPPMRRYQEAVAVLPAVVQQDLEHARPAALASIILRAGWKIAAATGLVAALVEFIRGAAWEDVLSLFAYLGWSQPKDRDDAEAIATAVAENKAA